MADVNAVFEKIYRRQYYRHVPFLRVMSRASHCIARFCVYGPDDGSTKIAGRNIRRTHRLWLKRLLVLCQRLLGNQARIKVAVLKNLQSRLSNSRD